MPSADQVPVKSPHSRMQWHMCGRLRVGKDLSNAALYAGDAVSSSGVFGLHERWPLCPPLSRSRSIPRMLTCSDTSVSLHDVVPIFLTPQAWSVQPCVRPVCAVHMTAGHNALRGSGPGQKPAFENAVAHVWTAPSWQRFV